MPSQGGNSVAAGGLSRSSILAGCRGSVPRLTHTPANERSLIDQATERSGHTRNAVLLHVHANGRV